jgi:predicted MFS family arabinose efflux permease
MSHRQIKVGCLVVTWLNVYAAAYYFNYVFFLLRDEWGFGVKQCLLFAAMNGLVYVPVALSGGKLAQRFGYFRALQWGLAIMLVALLAGLRAQSAAAHVTVMVLWTAGVCLTWPPLEALASERESRAGTGRMVGIYNLVWSGGAAISFFTGGALLETLGRSSLFWLPAIVHAVQLPLTIWLERNYRRLPAAGIAASRVAEQHPESPVPENKPANAPSFLRMAWIANPFAYVAMNSIIPVIPEMAARFDFSATVAGLVASVWMFARFGTFLWLWLWSGWHYHFGWLAVANVGMIGSFFALLLGKSLTVVVLAQLVFGAAVGLIYYSSLFYSMDAGDTHGEHGGAHEAAIGAGLFAGPATGAAALWLFPGSMNAGVLGAGMLLLAGFAWLLREKRSRAPAIAASGRTLPRAKAGRR